jgi:hypothetical protein
VGLNQLLFVAMMGSWQACPVIVAMDAYITVPIATDVTSVT